MLFFKKVRGIKSRQCFGRSDTSSSLAHYRSFRKAGYAYHVETTLSVHRTEDESDVPE